MTKKFFLSLSFILLLSFPFMAIANVGGNTGVGGGTGSPSATNTSTGEEEIGVVKLENPLGGADTSPQILIGRVINAVLGLVGSLALIMFIYGGFLWMTSAGNEQRVSKGRDILMWSTIGLIIIFSSYALVRFVISDLIGA